MWEVSRCCRIVLDSMLKGCHKVCSSYLNVGQYIGEWECFQYLTKSDISLIDAGSYSTTVCKGNIRSWCSYHCICNQVAKVGFSRSYILSYAVKSHSGKSNYLFLHFLNWCCCFCN